MTLAREIIIIVLMMILFLAGFALGYMEGTRK